MANNDITYSEAVELVTRKLQGELVDLIRLKAALTIYPEITQRLMAGLVPSLAPTWAKDTLNRMAELRQAELENLSERQSTGVNQPDSATTLVTLTNSSDFGFSMSTIFRRFGELNLDKDFVTNRLIPRSLVKTITKENFEKGSSRAQELIREAAEAMGRPFGWSSHDILKMQPLQLNPELVGSTRYKIAVSTNRERTTAYTAYALYLALSTLHATQQLPAREIPTDPAEVRKTILTRYGKFNFETTLRYIWDLGIPVLPLNDAGAFHGACWRTEGRNIILLKQKNHYQERWLTDLLHELYHAAQEPEQSKRTVVETEEMLINWPDDPEEKAANRFAWSVALDGQARKLETLCETESRGQISYLKNAIVKVANNAQVPVGVLANYMAFRLGVSGQEWWSTAKSFQTIAPNPLVIARRVFLEKVDLTTLNELDRELLLQALSEAEEEI